VKGARGEMEHTAQASQMRSILAMPATGHTVIAQAADRAMEKRRKRWNVQDILVKLGVPNR
jgi:hypothetical protein